MKRLWGLLLLMMALAGCGRNAELASADLTGPATLALPGALFSLPEGAGPSETAPPRRYAAYRWPADFQPPLEIRIVTPPIPKRIIGPTPQK